MINNTGLVLEGGGMRCAYTSGVLEYFLENDLFFNYVIGVSAGACNASSYLSRQKGRNKVVNIEFIKDSRYLSFKNLFTSKSLFGMDFIFYEIPNNLVPFDFDTFLNIKEKFVIVVTDCETGQPLYYHNFKTKEEYIEILKASSSLPYVSKIVNYKGKHLLDGGITDSIPIKKSIKDGNNKNVIILTRNKAYRKKPARINRFAKIKYKRYPKLIKALKNRYKVYNDTLDYIEKLERENKVFVIRPEEPLSVGRFEKDKNKLYGLYNKGYEEMKKNYKELKEFLQK